MPGQIYGGERLKLHIATASDGTGKTEVGNFEGFTPPTPTTTEGTITDSSTPPGTTEKISGDTDRGSMTLNCNYNKTDPGQLILITDDITNVKPARWLQMAGGPSNIAVLTAGFKTQYQQITAPAQGTSDPWKIAITVGMDTALDPGPTLWP